MEANTIPRIRIWSILCAFSRATMLQLYTGEKLRALGAVRSSVSTLLGAVLDNKALTEWVEGGGGG